MFNKHKKNFYSENGEDGVLLYILKKTKIIKNTKPLWCCEFGAWDGIHGSNTFNLVINSKENLTNLLLGKRKLNT